MFRLLIAALAAAMLLSLAPSAHAQEPTPVLGYCDAEVSSRNALLILWLDIGLIDGILCTDGDGDLNNDGALDVIDAALILQIVHGLIDVVPPTPPEASLPPASGTIAIGSVEANLGQQGTVTLEALGITTPGLGAWTIEVEYDPAVVSVVRCRPAAGGAGQYASAACNRDYSTEAVRLSGTEPSGLEGDTALASLTFECITVSGATDLIVNVQTFADATIGGPQPINPTVTNGSITCAEPPLPTLRPGNSRLNITLIHDLNADGVFDPGEPGIEGWSVDVFPWCSDMILRFEATDAAGRTSGEVFGENVCINVRPVGWVLTSGSRLVNVEPGTTVEAVLLFRKVGQEYFRLTGDLIVNGLPASDKATLDALFRGQSCGDAQISVGVVRTRYTLYVLGETDRPGCGNEGQSVDITVNGEFVQEETIIFNQSANSEDVDLVLGPTPMWFNAFGRDGVPLVPYVGAVTCGEARALFPDYYEIYVFPDALRSGCGAPGRIVTLRVGDEVLRNVVWQEGFVEGYQLKDVVLPVVGASAQPRALAQPSGSGFSMTGARTYAVALALLGLSLLSGGAVIWRRRRAG